MAAGEIKSGAYVELVMKKLTPGESFQIVHAQQAALRLLHGQYNFSSEQLIRLAAERF